MARAQRAVPWNAAAAVAVLGLGVALGGPARGARESRTVQRRLLALAEQTLAEVREINRKIPSTPAPLGR